MGHLRPNLRPFPPIVFQLIPYKFCPQTYRLIQSGRWTQILRPVSRLCCASSVFVTIAAFLSCPSSKEIRAVYMGNFEISLKLIDSLGAKKIPNGGYQGLMCLS